MTSTGSRSSRDSSSPAFALVYLAVGLTDVSIDGRFVWPIVLVALGAAGVATAVSANHARGAAVRRGARVDDEQG